MQAVAQIDGTPFKDFEQDLNGKITEKGDLSLRQAIRLALNNTDKSDEEKKLEYFGIINKIFATGLEEEVELTSDEIVLIHNKVKQRWSTEAFGFIYNVLEGKNTKFKLVEKVAHHQV